MNDLMKSATGLLILAALSACGDTGAGANGEPRLIAQAKDTSVFDQTPLQEQPEAIAYDPDGCQNWLIDDGAEGYATRRRDPRTGLPVCNTLVPPGYVVDEYRTNSFPDILP